MTVRRIDVSEEIRALDTLAGPDYASAFEVVIAGTDVRSPEQWARAVFEGAPLALRWFLPAAWALVLGLRLGPRPSPGHVLGWRIADARPDTIVLELHSRLLTAHNVLRVEGSRLTWATFVRYERWWARALWSVAAPVHHRTIPYLLQRAANRAGRDATPRRLRARELQYRAVTLFQRRILNPVTTRLPSQTLLETTGRKSGRVRRTPIGGRRTGRQFWLVSEYGEKSQYVRNIQADPQVRVRVGGRWHNGTAHLVPQDDARARLRSLPRANSAAVKVVGTNLLTVRVDLTD